MVKKIAVYESYEACAPVRQRYWKRRRDGIKQRYWKKTRWLKKVVMSGRYEFHGSGKDLYRTVIKAYRIMPKGFVDVSAEKFLAHSERYGFGGRWIEREAES